MRRRVVVTGVGTINSLGHNNKETFEAIKNGVCGIERITAFDTTDFKVKLAAEVKNFDPNEYLDKKVASKTDRFIQLALIAGKEAYNDANLDEVDKSRMGVNVSSGIGGIDTIETNHSKGLKKGMERVSPFFVPNAIVNMAAGQLAIATGAKGMCTCVVTACAGATNAIGDGFRVIRDGYEDVMLVGGAEACITPLGVGGFSALKALSTSEDPNRASIPFDKERNGFVIGEGAGILVLEEYEHAKKRGAKIYAEVIGYGTSCDAHHITAPLEDGSGGQKAMENALNDAGIQPSDVDYINTHGTSTHLNDKIETKAIANVFGKDVVISSTKGNHGHCLGATGAIEAIISIDAMNENIVPPTINYQVADEECYLDVCPNTPRQKDINIILSNSLGFGGHNATVVFKKVK